MRLSADEKTVPRLHLIGTLATVIALTLVLGAFFSWRSFTDHRESIERVAHAATDAQKARLSAELNNALGHIEFARNRTEQVLRESLISQVDTALQIAEAIHARESARRSTAEVKRLIIEALRPVRFYDGRGYYFIDDMQGQFILLPTAPKLEGTTKLDNQDDTGHYIMRGLIEAARKPRGEGFSRYRWYMPGDQKTMADKLAYVRHFAPYDWLIGTGDYLYEWEARQKQAAIERLRGMRFGSSGYIAGLDQEGRGLVSPSAPDFEGRKISERSAEQQVILERIRELGASGGGYLSYAWTTSGDTTPIPRTSLVKVAQPWGWTMVASMADDELQAALREELRRQASLDSKRISTIGLALLAALAVGLLASFGFSLWSGKLFKRYHDEIETQATVLRENENRYRTLADSGQAMIWTSGTDKLCNYFNQVWLDFTGRSLDQELGNGWTEGVHPDDMQHCVETYANAFDQRQQFSMDYRLRRHDGEYRWLQDDGKPRFDAAGGFIGYIGYCLDITERKASEQLLRIAATAFESHEGMFITDTQSRILRINNAFSEITGYSSAEVIGKTPTVLNSGRHDEAFFVAMWQSLAATRTWQGEIWNRRKNGEIFPEWLTISAVSDEQGTVTNYVGAFSDITQHKASEEEIKNLAFFDPLTQLPNRRLMQERLHQAMSSNLRSGREGALVFIDLDNFKALNDTYGHSKGDLLLKHVAARLSGCVRDGDTVARLGGDEFVVMLEDLSKDAEEAASQTETVSKKILSVLNQPYDLDGLAHHSTPSIGIALFGDHRNDSEDLMRRADLAMYEAKRSGRNTLRFFDPEMQERITSRNAIEAALHQAVIQGQFLLHYQAQVDPAGVVVGAEALVRWRSPERGMVSPAEFIPLAEESGLIVPIGFWVLREACTQLDRWAQNPALAALTLAVSVSARQFSMPTFVDEVMSLIEHFAIDPARLKLELTESLLLENTDEVIAKMTALRNAGVKFSLDDFGTGYSSLAYLKRLPLEQIKIDQSFVRDLEVDENDALICAATISLAHSMRFKVVAEGVETDAQRQFLTSEHRCDLMQGFLFSKPLPLEEFEAYATCG